MGLFGPEWTKSEPPKPVARPKRTRRLPVCPDWIADAVACENCGGPRCTSGPFKKFLAACPKPSCSRLISRSQITQKIESARRVIEESQPEQPDAERCLRIAWRYLRGRMRRG